MKLFHSFSSLLSISCQVFLLSDTITFVNAYPHEPLPAQPLANDSSFWNHRYGDVELAAGHVAKRDQVDLRIMPLGASIVFGLRSSDANGFRKTIRDQLRYDGHQVDMVGTKHGGTMKDNDCEATSGFVITEIHDASKLSYKYKPNLVLINAGTNDIVKGIDNGNQGARLRSMIEGLWTNISPETVVILSTILVTEDNQAESRRGAVNEQYRNLVSTLYSEGRPIYLAEMDGWITKSDLDDGTHPHDDGYKKMAGSFWQAIIKARNEGRIKQPLATDALGDNTGCRKSPGDGVNAGAKTQVGSGYDDGIYYHNSEAMGTILTIESDWDRNQWFFARLFRQDRDDLLGWVTNSAGDVVYAVRRNDGNGKFTKIADMSVRDNCNPAGVVFIDLNADGLDDFACIAPNGAVFASINQGDGNGDNPPTFSYKGLWRAADSKYPQANVRLADIDGDGRADFCGLASNGDVYVWRNSWINDMPAYWQYLGQRFTGKNMGNLTGTRFQDINGDGRDDWVWVGEEGEAYTYTNSRSCAVGHEGNGLNVAWRQGFYTGKSSGPTHLGGVGTDVRNRIHFARIYGEPQDFGLLGKLDYVYMYHKKGSDGKHTFELRVWKNKGYGGTKLKADGVRYCDMTGNGRDDYVWILSKGEMDLFENGGKDFINEGESYWKQPFTKAFFKPDRDLDRRDLHLADFDGDGKCDIIWVDPNNQNRVSVWRNGYTEGGGFNWQYTSNPAPNLYCPEKRGLGLHDIPVRFADISGSGRADYLCIEKDGRVWGWTQDGSGSWEYIDQFFSAKEHDRANLRFADVDGDGRDDAIWVEKFSGDSFVYYNLDRRDIGGSRYWWETLAEGGPILSYGGSVAGSCQYFPDFDGNGKADLHSILGTFTNEAVTAYNLCTSNNSGDDGPTTQKPDMPTPGNGGGTAEPIEEGWKNIQCTHPGVTDAAKPADWRWAQIETPSAWSSVVQGWKYNQSNNINKDFAFPRSVSNFFNGPEMMDCHKLIADNGCHGGDSLQCDDTNHPAGYFILNSFRGIEAVLWNYFTTLDQSFNSIEADIGTFASNFAPLKKDTVSFNVILDIVFLGYAAAAAPMWNKFLKNWDFMPGRAGDYDTLKDFTNDMVNGGLTLAKDLATSDSKSLGTQNEVSTRLSLIIGVWKQSFVDFATKIFDGSEDSVTRLGKVIANGKMISSTTTVPTVTELKNSLNRAIYALLIPITWSVSDQDLNPFVVDSGLSCDDADGDYDIKKRITNGAIKSEKVCWQDRAFYLVAAKDPYENCKSTTTQYYCEPFDGLPGTSKMGASYGGVTREDIVVGSINSFKYNGNKNRDAQTLPGVIANDQLEYMQEDNIRGAGVFNLPICDVNTAVMNYLKYRTSKKPLYFPCETEHDLGL